MAKYPVDITDEENAKLKYPFLPIDQYTKIYKSGNATISIRHTRPLTDCEIEHMVQINRQILARQ